jgi:hypothetical protein
VTIETGTALSVSKNLETRATLTETEVAREITRLHHEVLGCMKVGMEKAFRIGQLLTEQKEKLGHGHFTGWVNAALPFTDRTARNYMTLWRNQDRLKTENVSVLSEAYKLLTAPRPIPDRPVELYDTAMAKLAIVNSVLGDPAREEAFPPLWEEAEASTRAFLESLGGYIEEGDPSTILRKCGWVAVVLLSLQNSWAELNMRIHRRYDALIKELESRWPPLYQLLKENNFSSETFECLGQALARRLAELEGKNAGR